MADYLIHYGIQGQKWGVRRYQNEDGSLTSEGYFHYYGKADKVAKSSKEYKAYKSAEKEFSKIRDRHVDEANRRGFRAAGLEEQYNKSSMSKALIGKGYSRSDKENTKQLQDALKNHEINRAYKKAFKEYDKMMSKEILSSQSYKNMMTARKAYIQKGQDYLDKTLGKKVIKYK